MQYNFIFATLKRFWDRILEGKVWKIANGDSGTTVENIPDGENETRKHKS